MLALEALDTNIGTKPHHLPFVAAAGVFFLQVDYVTKLQFHNHWLPLMSRLTLMGVLARVESSTHQRITKIAFAIMNHRCHSEWSTSASLSVNSGNEESQILR